MEQELTKFQRQILICTLKKKPYTEIAAKYNCSHQLIYLQVRSISRKLGIKGSPVTVLRFLYRNDEAYKSRILDMIEVSKRLHP